MARPRSSGDHAILAAGTLAVVFMGADDPVAIALTTAIQQGDLDGLRALLDARPDLVDAEIGEPAAGAIRRSVLHLATDWPGHFPDNVATVRLLIERGAGVNARCSGPHTETPLHWAASTDDVAVLDALLDAGADIDAPGAVIAGGGPIAEATAFGQPPATPGGASSNT